MKRFLSIAAASLALVAAQSASAQSFTTTLNTTFTYDGMSVLVQKGGGPVLTCTLSIDIINDGTTIEASNPVLTGFGGACDTVDFLNAPWTVTSLGANLWRVGTAGTADEIFVDTTITPGDCKGDLVLEYLGGDAFLIDTGFTTPPRSTIPEDVVGSGDCKVDGVIDNP